MTRTDVTSAIQPSRTFGLAYSQPVSAVSGGILRSVANKAGYAVAAQTVSSNTQNYSVAQFEDRNPTLGMISEGKVKNNHDNAFYFIFTQSFKPHPLIL